MAYSDYGGYAYRNGKRVDLTMDAAPDLEALRARRNAAVQGMHQKMADEWGVPLQSLRSNFNPAACYWGLAPNRGIED